jgi:hypothetical protein
MAGYIANRDTLDLDNLFVLASNNMEGVITVNYKNIAKINKKHGSKIDPIRFAEIYADDYDEATKYASYHIQLATGRHISNLVHILGVNQARNCWSRIALLDCKPKDIALKDVPLNDPMLKLVTEVGEMFPGSAFKLRKGKK